MKKIDISKQQYLLFIDTETIGTLNNIESVMPFEIGMKVYDNINKKVVKEKSYLVKKFFNNKYVMMSTFSATKYPEYLTKVGVDKRYKVWNVNEIATDIEKIIARYNINIMVAHNGAFDKESIARLFEEFGIKNPIKKLDLLDTMEISKIITFDNDYAQWCLQNQNVLTETKERKFITNSGRVRLTAQAIYCYIVDNTEFEEAHTGLEDINIEIEIFKESIYRLGNMMVELNVAPSWRDYSIVLED